MAEDANDFSILPFGLPAGAHPERFARCVVEFEIQIVGFARFQQAPESRCDDRPILRRVKIHRIFRAELSVGRNAVDFIDFFRPPA